MVAISETRPGPDADEQITALMERRHSPEDDERIAEEWAASAMRHNFAAAAERRREWARYHMSLWHLHSRLAAEHEEKALALLDQAKGVHRA